MVTVMAWRQRWTLKLRLCAWWYRGHDYQLLLHVGQGIRCRHCGEPL